jgi:hypothetical protein
LRFTVKTKSEQFIYWNARWRGIGWYCRQTKPSRKLEQSEKEKAGSQAKNEKQAGKQKQGRKAKQGRKGRPSPEEFLPDPVPVPAVDLL